MSDLTGLSIASTFDRLLALPSGGGDTTTLVPLTDGNGVNVFALQISSAGIKSTGTLEVTGNVDFNGDLDVDGTSNLDNTDIDGTFTMDGSAFDVNATTTCAIDNANTTNGVTIGTNTNSMPITIGHTASVTTIQDELDVTGTVDINDTTDTSSGTTGALKVDGGVGIAKKLFVGTDATISTGNLIITAAAKGIIHTNSGTVTQLTNHTTGVTLNTTSGVIQLAAVALANDTNAEFTVTNSTVQADSVILLTMQDENTTDNAQLSCAVHTIAGGSFKISLMHSDATCATSATASKIHFLVINNS